MNSSFMRFVQTDVAIIGAGIGASLLAHILQKNTVLKIDIFEATDQSGGQNQALTTLFGALDYGPKVIPNKPEYVEAVKFVEGLLGSTLVNGIESSQLMTLEKGELSSFVGFGDKKPAAISEWDYYLSNERLSIDRPLYTISQALLAGTSSQIHLKSELTRLEIQDGRIIHAIVNGDTQIEAKSYILFFNPSDALKLLPQNQIDAKTRQKVSKTKFWTSISLNMYHKGEFSTQESPFVFVGPGENPFVTFGFFHKPRQETSKLVQASQWLTLVSPEDGEEEEIYAHAIREMKKNLTKAFPGFQESILFEKITVSPNSHGQISVKSEKDESFHGFKNLWLGHGSCESSPNIPGAIIRAQKIAQELLKKFESASKDLPTVTDTPSLL